MKTQRRHELQTNALASSLAHWIELAKPYSRAVVATLIAVAVGLGVWAYLSTEKSRRQGDGWNEYFLAMSRPDADPTDALRDIATRYAGTMVGQWSKLTLGDVLLVTGTNGLMTSRGPSRERLRDAAERFQELLIEAQHPTILQRASYGLAQAHEALGDLEQARKDYRTLAEKWPDGAFAAVAKGRADELEDATTKNFYDWLAKYEPPKPLAKEPGTPGTRPDFLKEPDEGGILSMPPLTENPGGPALPSVVDEPTAVPSETPAGEAPPSDAPASDTPRAVPADEAAPAPEEQPAAPVDAGLPPQ